MGQASVSITAELVAAATTSSLSSSSLLFVFRASICCRSSGSLAFGCDSDGSAGHSTPGKVSDVGEAGEAGETGDGGDIGEVGDGGERGGDGKGRLTHTSLSRLSLASESAGATGGSELFSSVVVRFSWGRDCTWPAFLILESNLRSWL